MAVVINGTTGIDKVQDGSIVSADLDTNIAVAGTFTSTGLITASAGVAIGGTGSANTLDDYEEGTWTPVITPESQSAASITTQENTYIKIGRLVVIQFKVTITSISGTSSSRAIELTGMPFNASSTNTGGTSIMYTGLTGSMTGQLITQTTAANLIRIVNVNGTSAFNASDHLQANSTLRGTISYFSV